MLTGEISILTLVLTTIVAVVSAVGGWLEGTRIGRRLYGEGSDGGHANSVPVTNDHD